MAASSTTTSLELCKRLSEIQQLLHEPIIKFQVDLEALPTTEVQVAYSFKMENLKELTHNISALKPKYALTREEYERLNTKYLAVARAKDPSAWTPYESLSHYKEHINPYLLRGTCEGQVLAIAEAAFDNPILSADFLAERLSNPDKIDEILLFHIMQGLENSSLSLLRGEKFDLKTPYLFPSPCSPNGPEIGSAVSHELINSSSGSNYGISCGKDYERHLLLLAKLFEKFFEKRNCIGLEVATKSMFAKHIMFLGKVDNDEYIAYDPDHSIFYQGAPVRVLNALFSRYKVNAERIQFNIHEFKQNFPEVEWTITKPKKMSNKS